MAVDASVMHKCDICCVLESKLDASYIGIRRDASGTEQHAVGLGRWTRSP